MRLIGLARHEVSRMLIAKRAVFGVPALGLLGGLFVLERAGSIVSTAGGTYAVTAPILAVGALCGLGSMLSIWPFLFGGTLAEDLASGSGTLLLLRGGSRRSFIGAKLLSAYLTSFVALLFLAAVWALMASLVAPWRVEGLAETLPFWGDFAETSPLLFEFVLVAMIAIAATATCALSMLIGSLTRNPLASQIGASLVYMLAILVLPSRFNPGDRAPFIETFAPWATPMETLLYWLALSATFALLTYVAVHRKEIR